MIKLPTGFGVRQPSGAFCSIDWSLSKSGGGLPQSKTQSALWRPMIPVAFGKWRATEVL